MHLNKCVCLAAFLAFFISAQTSFGESYRWVDDDGVLHFSDRRPVNGIEESAPPSLQAKRKAEEKVEENAEENAEEKVDREKRYYDFRERVVNIIGMDKILLESGKIVKYIGVRDPAGYLRKNGFHEKVDEAENFHSKLVVGKDVTVLLGKKIKNKKRQYLGHVFLGQDSFINAELIRNGYAITEEYPSDFEYQSLFIRLQRDAQNKGLGLWKF